MYPISSLLDALPQRIPTSSTHPVVRDQNPLHSLYSISLSPLPSLQPPIHAHKYTHTHIHTPKDHKQKQVNTPSGAAGEKICSVFSHPPKFQGPNHIHMDYVGANMKSNREGERMILILTAMTYVLGNGS